MYHRSRCKTFSYQTSRGKHRRNTFNLGVGQRFLRNDPKSAAIREQIGKCGLHQSLKSLLLVRDS